SDYGAPGGLEPPEHLLPPRRQRSAAHRIGIRELADVRPGDESPPGTSQKDPAHVITRLDLVHDLAQPANDLRVERIQLVRAVDSDGGDAVGDGKGDGHGSRDSGPGTGDCLGWGVRNAPRFACMRVSAVGCRGSHARPSDSPLRAKWCARRRDPDLGPDTRQPTPDTIIQTPSP